MDKFFSNKRSLLCGVVSTISHNTDMRYMPTNCMIPISSNLTAIKKIIVDLVFFGSDYILVACYPHLQKFFEYHLGSYMYSKNSQTSKGKHIKVPIIFVSPPDEDLVLGVSATEICLKSIRYFHSTIKYIQTNNLTTRYLIHYWDCMLKLQYEKLSDLRYCNENSKSFKINYHVNYTDIFVSYNNKCFLDGYEYPFTITSDIAEKAIENIDKQKFLTKINNNTKTKKTNVYNSKYFSTKKIFNFLNKDNFLNIEADKCYKINTNRKYRDFFIKEFK